MLRGLILEEENDIPDISDIFSDNGTLSASLADTAEFYVYDNATWSFRRDKTPIEKDDKVE